MKNVAVVIGPGQIGQAIARRVGIGKHVLLADMRRENADAAATVMANAGYEVSVATVDVSSRAVGKDWWAGIEAAQIHWGSAHVSGYCGYLDYDGALAECARWSRCYSSTTAHAAADFNPPEPQIVALREIERLSQRRAD